MAVYVVYRSHYDPACKCLKRFEDATVLDWFRNHWRQLADADEANDRLAALLGFFVYGFGSVFAQAAEQGWPPPRTDEQLADYLHESLIGDDVFCEAHLLTVGTYDYRLEVAYYVFDDVYLARYPSRAAYLAWEGWRLPGGHADRSGFEPAEPTDERGPHGTGAGDTYVFMACYLDSSNLTDPMGLPSRIRGVRIPDLCRHLIRSQPGDGWSAYLSLLRAQLLAAPVTADPVEEGFRQSLLNDPDDTATWSAYADWLQERGERPAGLAHLERGLDAVTRFPVLDLSSDAWEAVASGSAAEARAALERVLAANPPRDRRGGRKLSCIQVEEHLAQLCLHADCSEGVDLYHRWIFFDDLWAAAHPDLANSILRYDRCWDVLSPDGPHEGE